VSENPAGKPRFLSLSFGSLREVRAASHNELGVTNWWRVAALPLTPQLNRLWRDYRGSKRS